jgi:hypothetical protein
MLGAADRAVAGGTDTASRVLIDNPERQEGRRLLHERHDECSCRSAPIGSGGRHGAGLKAEPVHGVTIMESWGIAWSGRQCYVRSAEFRGCLLAARRCSQVPQVTRQRSGDGPGQRAVRGTIRPAGDCSPVLASGPARGTPGHRGHCRVSPVQQFRRAGGFVTAFSGDGEAMDKQPGQRQCDGQQQPGPQPGR